jgi:MFS family permease
VTTTSVAAVAPAARSSTRRDRFASMVRRLSAVTVAGALSGLVVGEVCGRLADPHGWRRLRLLQPAELAIALFVLIPGLCAAVLTLLVERWLRPDAWSSRKGLSRDATPLLVWALAFPLLIVVFVVSAGRCWRRSPS